MKTFHIRELINNNIKRFVEYIDIIDLKEGIGVNDTSQLLLNLGYTKSAITQAEHIYLLSERGYAKLIKIMDSDLFQIKEKCMENIVVGSNRTYHYICHYKLCFDRSVEDIGINKDFPTFWENFEMVVNF